MSTVSHKDLTGADVHEPKGAASAASGTVYVSNGSGSGSWITIAALTGAVGEVKAFTTFAVPSGFLELDGSEIDRTTYSNLFNIVSLQQTGSRTNGSPTISGLSSTSNVFPGQYIGGSGIPLGATVFSTTVNTITMSVNATSTGSSNVIASIYPLGNGTTTFNLPDTKTTRRFLRSRGLGGLIAAPESNQNASHTHAINVSNTSAAGGHNHIGTTDTEGSGHTHTIPNMAAGTLNVGTTAPANYWLNAAGTVTTSGASATHTHTFTTASVSNHTHAVAGTSDASGGTEARPEALSVIWAVRY